MAGGDPLVVHTHSSKAGILGRAAARAAGADAVVHSIHGFGFHDGQSKPTHALYVGLERMASRWTDAFVAVSEENIRTGVQEGIFRRERCRLIRSGFDTARFLAGSRAAGRKILGIPEGVPVVGTVAVFKPQKAPLDFVETARRVASEIPDSRFVMVGDGEMRGETERAVCRDRDVGSLFVPRLASRGPGPDGGLRRVPSHFPVGRPSEGGAAGADRRVPGGGDGGRRDPGDRRSRGGWRARPSGGRRVPSPAASSDILAGRLPLDAAKKRERLVREFDQDEMVRAQERLYAEILAGKGFPGWS